MVPILHRELERKVEKVKHMHEVGGHAAEDQKQYEFPAWINHNWSLHVNSLWRMEGRGRGRGRGLIEKGAYSLSSSEKGEGLIWEGGA